MAEHLYLPRLEGNIEKVEKPGYWKDYTKKAFLAISDGISIADIDVKLQVSSVPDVWARPLMFQSALRHNSGHPLRPKLLQEWRGLLSLFALARTKNFMPHIEIVPVQLGDGVFAKSAAKLAQPSVQLEKETAYSWSDIFMIRYKGVPLGAFSPTTLVYTSSSYNQRFRENKAEFSELNRILDGEFHLKPPSDPKKDHREIRQLGKWLQIAKRDLDSVLFSSEMENRNNREVSLILALLSEWLHDIKDLLGVRQEIDIEASEDEIGDENIPLKNPSPKFDLYRVFKVLTRPLRAGKISKNSDLSLDFSPDEILIDTVSELKDRPKEIIIITERLLATEAIIWGQDTLRDFGGDAKACMERIFNKAWGREINGVDIFSTAGAIWVRPDLLFLSDNLIRAKEKRPLIVETDETRLNKSPKYVYPFQRHILSCYSAEDIINKLKPEMKETSDGSIRFRFELPTFMGPEVIERTYRTKPNHGEGRLVEIDIPFIEIYPKYLNRNWRNYTIFHDQADSVRINPLVNSRNIRVERKRDFKNSTTKAEHTVRLVNVNGDNAFPEGLEFQINMKDDTSSGVILLSRSEEPAGLSKELVVGIDFGTSNTNVYGFQKEEEVAKKWELDFQKHVIQITHGGNPEKVELMRELFVPLESKQLPIPSTLRINDPALKEQVLLDYFLYFPKGFELGRNSYSDIKWDTEKDNKIELFLTSLLYPVLVEVVAGRYCELEIRYSYPKAFSRDSIMQLELAWESALNKLLKSKERVLTPHCAPGDEQKLRPEIRGPLRISEGVAAGEFFASARTVLKQEDLAAKHGAAVCLDVGGGTTDISVWNIDSIDFDGSITLAGRQLANLFRKNSRIREKLFSQEACRALENAQNNPTEFSAKLNLILKEEESRIANNLVNSATNPDNIWLRQMIALEFCAISYYAAMLTIAAHKNLKRENKPSDILKRLESEIGIHWGGNAAKLITWIDLGRYSKEDVAGSLLSATFFNALKYLEVAPKRSWHLQSPSHKSEAAGGLVAIASLLRRDQDKRVLEDKDGFRRDHDPRYGVKPEAGKQDDNLEMEMKVGERVEEGFVVGEVITTTDGQVDGLSFVSHDDLYTTNNTKFQGTTLVHLTKFMEIFNYFGVQRGLFKKDKVIEISDRWKTLIADSVLKEYIRGINVPATKRFLEPVFITEVKALQALILDTIE